MSRKTGITEEYVQHIVLLYGWVHEVGQPLLQLGYPMAHFGFPSHWLACMWKASCVQAVRGATSHQLPQRYTAARRPHANRTEPWCCSHLPQWAEPCAQEGLSTRHKEHYVPWKPNLQANPKQNCFACSTSYFHENIFVNILRPSRLMLMCASSIRKRSKCKSYYKDTKNVQTA